jgi:hypothetical protein
MVTVCRHAGRLVAFAAVAVLAAGCGGPELADVDGVVTLDGAPLPDVEVVFVPEAGGGNARAYTDAQGRYRLKSDGNKRGGAAAGTYRVLVTDLAGVPDVTALAPPGAGEPAGPKAAKPRRFPATYGDLRQTPLTAVEVKPGKQTLNFDVKARGK